MKRKERIWLASMNIFAHSCHQRADRSFFLFGYQFPVCARCSGLYLGYLCGILAALWDFDLPVWFCVMGILFLCCDGIAQRCERWTSNNFRRVISGLWCGSACVQLFWYFLRLL